MHQPRIPPWLGLSLLLLAACAPATPQANSATASTATAPDTAVAPAVATSALTLASAGTGSPSAVRLDNPSGDNRCHYGPSIGPAEGVPVHSAPHADALVTGHLPQDWTVFACTFSDDGLWMGVVHEYGQAESAHCPPADADCSLAQNCAVTLAQTTAGQAYTGRCHSGWILSELTYALTD